MALSEHPAERTGRSAGCSTDGVLGARDSPSPVAGWPRATWWHLTEWLPPFLSAGAGIQLPEGRRWTRTRYRLAGAPAVQALLETGHPGPGAGQPPHRRAAAGRGGRPVLHRGRLHAHDWPGPPASARWTPTSAAAAWRMEQFEEAILLRPVRAPGSRCPRTPNPDQAAGLHRPRRCGLPSRCRHIRGAPSRSPTAKIDS